MAEDHVVQDRRWRARLLGGRISCAVGLLLGVGQIFAALLGAGANVTAGVLGIGFCIVGYYLDSRRLAVAVVVVCAAAVLFGLAASQGLIPGIAPSDRAIPDGSFRF
jgi:hypothetical protein